MMHSLGLTFTSALFLTASLATPAFATQPERSSTAVRYSDLNLSTPAGVKALHRRIAVALESVCGSYAGTDTAATENEADEITRCRAVNRAVLDQRVAALLAANVQVAVAR